MQSFHNRVAVITGAASGIGRALAVRLAGAGASIAALDVNADALDSLRREFDGKPFASVVADVTDLVAMRSAVAQLEQRLGPTDLLVASAGIGRRTSGHDFNAADVNALIQVNLIGVANSIDAVLSGMRQRRSGHLVALSSIASYRGVPHLGGYCASKAGVNALLDSLRVELAPFNIRVTTVCPGWIRTPMTAPLNLPPHEVMEVDKAAGIIFDTIARQRSFVAFPSHQVRNVWMLRNFPRAISDWMLSRWMARQAPRIQADASSSDKPN